MVQHSVLQRAIETAINQPNYAASLPPLSDKTWMKILEDTRHARAENERLEFVGDALMYATLGRQLYTQVPNGTPGLYTVRPPSLCILTDRSCCKKTVRSCGTTFERHILLARGEVGHYGSQQLGPASPHEADVR